MSGEGTTKEHALTQIAYPDGTHRYFTYDENGRLANTSVDGNTEQILFSYDSAGSDLSGLLLWIEHSALICLI